MPFDNNDSYLDAFLAAKSSGKKIASPYGVKIRNVKAEEVTDTPLIAKEGFMFGCDPELFVYDPDGNVVSAAGLLPGTKEEPFRVEEGSVQVDGMAAEFNIDPCSDFATFNRRIKSVMEQMGRMLPDKYTLTALPFARFSQDAFDKAPDEAKALGCMPDFDAWTGEVNVPPENLEDPLMRCAAGHVHIGWEPPSEANLTDPQHIMNCRDMVKQLDWYLGGWSIKLDPDPTRRSLYGKAGACRYKPYGVEYRVLSNFWVTTRERRLAVWNRIQTAIHDMHYMYIPDRVIPQFTNMLIQSINTSQRNPDLERSFVYPLNSLTASPRF